MDSQDIKQTSQFIAFNECYNFWKRWRHISQTDAEWEKCIADAEKVRLKHHGNFFLRLLLNEVIHELERSSKLGGGSDGR